MLPVSYTHLDVYKRQHVAGSIHADVTSPAPQWLVKPTDVNALDRRLWSDTVDRGAGGVLTIGGLTAEQIVEQTGSPVYVIDELDFRGRALSWREAFAGW